MRLLASLCNLPEPTSSPLLLIDTDSAACCHVDLGTQPDTARSAVGLCVAGSVIYCAWIGVEQDSYLTILEKQTLAPIGVVKVEGVRDVHSVSVVDGWIYIVSTGTDEVHRLNASHPGEKPEVVWQASAAGHDTHHVNAILPVSGRLLCSAFGPKSAERWSSALDGYVIDIGSGEVLWRGIEHPHSLAEGPDGLYVAESRRSRIKNLNNGRQFSVDGYARGLTFIPDGLAVAGASCGRARSRTLGTIENRADPGEPGGETALTFFRPSREGGFAPAGTIDLSAHGPEIYDVIVLTT